MRTLCTLCWILSLAPARAQHTNFNTKRMWFLNKKEVFFGGGITQFAGDLGGVYKISSQHGISDLDLPSTSWNALGGYLFRFHPYWATSSHVDFGQLRGNDALKTNPAIRSRNLHFQSFYVELSQRIECLLFEKTRQESRYPTRKRPRRYFRISPYMGAGILLYNPKAHYQGKWVALHALRTEGQGLPGGSKAYKRISASIPLGVSFQVELSRMWNIGMEAEYVFTFTDYLDDVGGRYYDQTVLATELGEASAYLSNPSTQNSTSYGTGQPRGDKKLDGFFSFGLIFSRNVTYKNYAAKKHRQAE